MTKLIGKSMPGIDVSHVFSEPPVEDGLITAGPDTDSGKVTVVKSGSEGSPENVSPDVSTAGA